MAAITSPYLSAAELRDFVDELRADPVRWRHLVRHEPDHRVFVPLHEDERVVAWVICWSEEQDTGFHDHDGSAAAIAVVEGEIREDRLTIGGLPVEATYGPGDSFELGPATIHRVLHTGNAPAVTIHAYSPPLRRMGAYAIAPDGTLRREAVDDDEELRPLDVALAS
jgi:quercetin dioxygenase-like cupin family protein